MKEFFDTMKDLLSDSELKDFIKEYDKKSYIGVRVNTLKCSVDKLTDICKEIKLKDRTPFCNEGFYLTDKTVLSGNHPLHHAGAIYFQEPSAMSAAVLLAPEKGDFVLDLCAAPGGKSTQIASALSGTGLLWSNEIVKSRANILLGNIERCGIKNAVVSNTSPEVLCEHLEGVFDKVLVDAPCSGEGMFRRDENARLEWSVEHTKACAVRQLKILESARKALKPGGILVYSTCTFSLEENEGVMGEFLKANPDFELIDSGEDFGRPTLDGKARRIYPMDGGEGHFAAKLRKKGDNIYCHQKGSVALTIRSKIPDFVTSFFTDTFYDTTPYKNIYINADKVYILPEDCPDINGTGVIRAGIFAGIIKKNRFEPEHALFMSADTDNVKRIINLSIESQELAKFLRGEEISAVGIKGYTAVCAEGIIIGFGKASGGVLKNKYPKGLRNF